MINIFLIGLAIFAAGVLTGVFVVMVVGIHREERAYSLSDARPGPLLSGSRVIMGAYADPWVADSVGSRRRELVSAGSDQSASPRRS